MASFWFSFGARAILHHSDFPFFKRLHPTFLITDFFGNSWTYPLAFLPFLLFVILVLVGSSNAVNLTDGLDGLAIGCLVVSASA